MWVVSSAHATQLVQFRLTRGTLLQYFRASQPVLVSVLAPPVENEKRTKERDAVDVAEQDGGAGVQAEGANRTEGRHEADVEGEDICERGDGDRDGRLFVCVRQAGLHSIVHVRLLPTGD